MSWWQEGSRNQWLKIHKLPDGFNESTAVVTHAGKNNQETIDMAVMLGVSLTRHMPGHPKIALGIKGMTDENQAALKGAGWHLVLVGGWRAPGNVFSMCGDSCVDDEFINRFQNSWERLNAFRLPLGRVLYLDATTYVTNDVSHLMPMNDYGSIGMVPSSCKQSFRSGVMLFRPNLEKYRLMMRSVAEMLAGNATKRSDDQIINSAYQGRIFALDDRLNCISDSSSEGTDACSESCFTKVAAIMNFNGLPKPTLADSVQLMKFEEAVASGSDGLSAKMRRSHLSPFYCDLIRNKELLTKPLQSILSAINSACFI